MQALIDKDAIRDLVLCYSRSVDRQDFALLRTLYTPDGMEDNHGGGYSGPAEGYIRWLESVMPRLGVTTHGVQNHLIAIEGPDRAQGEVYVTAYHTLPAEGGGWTDLIHGMRYLDHYAKLDGRWLFARRTVVVDWKQSAPSSWTKDIPNDTGCLFGQHDATDASYAVLEHPLFAWRG
jgi:hypothetical protein